MRAAVAALVFFAACGGRGPIKGTTDGGMDHTVVGDAADNAAPPVDAPPAEVGVEAPADVGIDRGVDSAPRPDLGDPSHPMGVVVPIPAKVGAAGKPLDIPMEVAVDEKYFYFVSQVWDGELAGPWTLFRLPIAGGTAEPLFVDADPNAKLGVVAGYLYYWTPSVVREYDLKTGEDVRVVVGVDDDAIRSVTVGSDGVYWVMYHGAIEKASLRRHLAGGPADPEILTDGLTDQSLLAADGGQVFLSGPSTGVGVWDIATKRLHVLYNNVVSIQRRTPLDGNFIYVLGLGVVRVPRVPGTRAERLAVSPAPPSAELVLIGNHVVWRVGSESRWLAVPIWSGLETVPVAGLEGCDALLQGPTGRLFCVSAFYQRLSEVSLPGL